MELALEDASKLGTSASYTSSLASDHADFSQVVGEQLSSEQVSNPFWSVKIMAGWWRGAADRIDGVRECKNTGSKWAEACLGGTTFGDYCRKGHRGPMW